MRITGGLLTAIEYSLHARDHDAPPARVRIGFFDSLIGTSAVFRNS